MLKAMQSLNYLSNRRVKCNLITNLFTGYQIAYNKLEYICDCLKTSL